MNITSDIDDTNLTSLIFDQINENDLFNSTITTTLTTPSTTRTITTTTTTANVFFRLFNSTRIYPYLRPTLSPTQTSSVVNKYFIFQTSYNRNMRCAELFILSLTLPVYAVILMLFIQLTVLRISRNTAISGGGSRSRSQRRRQHLRSLIWTSNYILVDFLNLLYELAFIIIHISGLLPLKSFAGQFYCQLQVYFPLYLTVLMAYSLTAISIYRRRHFVSLNKQVSKSNIRSIIKLSALWLMPIITSIVPTYLLVHYDILKITQHETTNQCQISYTYESNLEAIYIFYRLGNIFLLPISISLACYVAIYMDLIRMQRRFNRAFKRHVHIRKNLISQILFLFLNFAVFWLPAEIILLSTKHRRLKDAAQVIKSLNILLDPLIITGFDTRFSSAARQLLSTWPFNQLAHCFNLNRQDNSSLTTITTARRRSLPLRQTITQPATKLSSWNMANNEDITVLESVSNHSIQKQRIKSPANQSRSRQRRRRQSIPNKIELVENHV